MMPHKVVIIMNMMMTIVVENYKMKQHKQLQQLNEYQSMMMND
jgi:hypothetical protein